MRQQTLGVLQLRNWATRGRLHAILDATDTPTVVERARRHPDTMVSLYKGRAEEEWFAIAPYVAAVDEGLLEWIVEDLWTEPWGIFVLSDASLHELRQHFRKFLTVSSPEGESWYFRFYDPRVLSTYLPTCTPEELTEFMGPARAFALADPASYGALVLSPPDGTVTGRAPTPQRIVIRT